MPLVQELEADGREVHVASLSFTYLNGLERARHIAEVGCLYEVTGACGNERSYCPEAWLAAFLGQPIWGFDKVGVRVLADARIAGWCASSRSISSC